MALTVDASTPAFGAGSNDPWVSPSFTPPNDSLLVVVCVGDWFGGTPTIAPTSTSLTFTSQGKFGAINNGVIEIFTAPVDSNGGTSRTVSVTTSISSDVGGAKVYVVTDHYAADPVEITGTNTGSPSGTNNFTPTVLTTTTDGCWVFGGAVNWVGGSLASTSTDTFEEFNDADLSVMVARKSAATSPAGAVTLNFDQVPAGTPVWTYGAIAIRPSTYTPPPPPPITVVSQGAAVAGSTSITTAAYGTGWATGDLIVYTVASGQSAENTPTVSGFTNIGSLSGGGGTFGTAGNGPRRLTFFTKTAAGGDDTTPTISLTSGDSMIAASTVLRADSGYSFDTAVAAFGAETTAGTGWSQAMTSDPGLDVDDVLLLACAVRDDTATSSAEGITATGATFDTVSERTDATSSTGFDIALHVSTTAVTAGPNSATPTRTATHATSETGVMGILRVRAISSGANVAATKVASVASIPAPTVVAQAHATATPTKVSAVAIIGSATALTFKYIVDTAGTGVEQHFVDAAGDPILVRGYVLWGLLTNAGRWNGNDWELDLESAVAALGSIGVNVLYTAPLGNNQNGANNNVGETHDGVAPFTGGDPATFNNTFWQRVDYLFDLCEAAGITVFFNIAYSDDLDNAALSGFTTGEFTDYGDSLAARYKTRPNLVWMVGGDYFDTFNTEITAVKTAIRAEGDTHLFGVQNYPETTSRRDIENNALQNTGDDNSEFNFVYTYNTTYWGVEHAYAESSPLAVMWGDGHFDQDTSGDRKVMRDLTWWAFSCGARGIIHGSEATWTWGSGALADLDSETYSSTDMGGIWDLFTSFTNWHQLVPDADSSFVTAGRGTKSDYVTSGGGEYNSSDTQAPYVTAGITADGTLAVVYFPVDQTITVDDTELAAGYTVTWVDPISGATTSETPAGTYSPTGSNSLGGADWLLVFEATADPNADVTPSTVAGTAAVNAPTVRLSKTATPSAVAATATAAAPTVRLSAAITPAVVSATAALPAPTVHAGAGAVPAAVAASTTTPAPTLKAGAGVVAAVVSGVAVLPAASVQTGASATATPSSVAGTAAVGTPALRAGQTVSAATVAGAATIPAPSVQAGANASVSATAVAGAAAISTPTVKAGAGVMPALVSGSASVGSPSVSTGATATPSLVAGSATIGAPGVSGGGSATASPQTVAGTAAVPTPSLSTSSRVNPTVVAGLAALPAPAIVSGAGATATPGAITRSVTISVPTIRLGAAITPAMVGADTDMLAPTMHTSVLVPVFSVAAVATIPPATAVSIVPGSTHGAFLVTATTRGAHGAAAATGAGAEYGSAASGASSASVPYATGG